MRSIAIVGACITAGGHANVVLIVGDIVSVIVGIVVIVIIIVIVDVIVGIIKVNVILILLLILLWLICVDRDWSPTRWTRLLPLNPALQARLMKVVIALRQLLGRTRHHVLSAHNADRIGAFELLRCGIREVAIHIRSDASVKDEFRNSIANVVDGNGELANEMQGKPVEIAHDKKEAQVQKQFHQIHAKLDVKKVRRLVVPARLVHVLIEQIQRIFGHVKK